MAPVSFSKDQIKMGTVTANEVWSGDIAIVGDVIVPTGATLRILPHSHLYFSPTDLSKGGKDPHKTEIIVHGSLLMDPEPGAPIHTSLMDQNDLIQTIEQNPNTQHIVFYPYTVETEKLREEFSHFSHNYFSYWTLVFYAWIILGF